LIVRNSTYKTLAANSTPITPEEFLPGDLMVSRDTVGYQGKVWIVMCVAENAGGDRRYIVGTGCDDVCDFHIPLFNNEKNYPWLTLDQVKALAPEEYPIVEYLRPTVN
jgi:hypothetical protein